MRYLVYYCTGTIILNITVKELYPIEICLEPYALGLTY